MSTVCCLAVILIFLVVTSWLLLITWWWLLVTTSCCSFSLLVWKRLQKKAVVTNAQEFADLAKTKFPESVTTLCLSDDICAETKFLKDRYKKASRPIPKTHSVHHLDVAEKKLVSNLQSTLWKSHPVGDSSANSGSVEGGSVVHIDEEIKQRDYVKIVLGNYLNMFAVVTEEMVDDEFVIQ